MLIPFGAEDKRDYFAHVDRILSSNRLTEGPTVEALEDAFSELTGLHSAALSSGGASLSAILEFIDVRGKNVAMPANTFWATAQAVRLAGGIPVYLDCNRHDLCLSYKSLSEALATGDYGAVIVVHIGGNIAFDMTR